MSSAGAPGPVTLLDGSDWFRAVMSTFCSGVVVVTATDPAAGTPIGMTAQSFLSLSLDPAQVLLCPARTSTTWPRIEAAGSFAVNVLREGQAQVSNRFAASGSDRFAGQAWSAGDHGAPLLEGALSHIECDLQDTFDGGDHLIVVGRVRATHLAADAESGPPLLYYRSRYQTLAASQ